MSPDLERLRVVVDARLRDGEPGGVQQIVIGLACGLSRLRDGHGEEYVFATWQGHTDWLRPFLAGACRLAPIRTSRVRAAGRWLRNVAAGTGVLGVLPSSPVTIAPNDAAIEALGGDIVHFPLQRAFLTDTPSIYQPHDLQHVHLPEYFSAAARRARDRVYRAYCEQASAVVVMSEWGREDLVRQFGLPRSKVAVVPWAPLLPEYPAPDDRAVATARRKYSLPASFAYFPAHTFPHKNHLALLDALARLRDERDLVVPLVCSGRQNEFYRVIRTRIRALRLNEQVRFLGFVSPLEVNVLYRTCRAVLFPTLFEGWGLPLSEAFVAGAPVACSRVTCLPAQAQGAAVLFDPRDEADIARAIVEVWRDDDVRARAIARGREIVSRLSWDRTAEAFRALYRKVASRPLSTRDLELLEAAPIC